MQNNVVNVSNTTRLKQVLSEMKMITGVMMICTGTLSALAITKLVFSTNGYNYGNEVEEISIATEYIHELLGCVGLAICGAKLFWNELDEYHDY